MSSTMLGVRHFLKRLVESKRKKFEEKIVSGNCIGVTSVSWWASYSETACIRKKVGGRQTVYDESLVGNMVQLAARFRN